MNIQEIVERYFEGVSSVEDEKMLREYFQNINNVAPEHRYLQPLFGYMSDEAEAMRVLDEIKRNESIAEDKRLRIRKLITSISSVAASLVLSVFLLFGYINNRKPDSYVWVDGKKISNPEVVSNYFEASFENVISYDNIMEQQLGAMFE